MATNFPANPTAGLTYTNGIKTWTYTGAFWQANNSSTLGIVNFDFDDISNYTDGYKNTFILKYNQNTYPVGSSASLQVTINGIDQRSFNYATDTFWMSNVLFANKGFTVVTSNTMVDRNTFATGVLKFAESVPMNSDVYIKYTGGIPSNTPKVYPFKPVDIVMGI